MVHGFILREKSYSAQFTGSVLITKNRTKDIEACFPVCLIKGGKGMIIRRFMAEDYDEVFKLWKECGIELGTSDSREEVLKLVERNPNTSLVGEEDGWIAAAVLGGFDGRRGLVHHLAVKPELQKKGYGREILKALEDEFRNMGVIKLSFWVKRNNIGVVEFYNKAGYELREDIVTMSKIL
jgi:ribosomal protein S18 acetylase RimI-like enzyme